MFNRDGSLKERFVRKQAPASGADTSGSRAAKENSSAASNNSPCSSPKAAGLRSKVTSIAGEGSPLRARAPKPGSDVRAAQNQGSFAFGREEAQDAATQHREVSDAKKRALYSSHVFGGGATPQRAAPELSQFKLREVTGSDIFNTAAAPAEEPQRAVLGGVRKAPGGGSSLSLKDPATPAPEATKGGRHPAGGQSSFSFGW